MKPGKPPSEALARQLRLAAVLLAERTAASACRALEASGVPCFTAKGVAAALSLHDDPLDRPFRDVDLFVPWGSLGLARASLASAGFLEATHLRSTHASVLTGPVRGGPDLDLQGWVGYPFLPLGGFGAIARRLAPIATASGPLPAPDLATHGCLAALFAVRDRLRPEAGALLADLSGARARAGEAALLARADELGLGRFVALALAALDGPSRWASLLRLADAAAPRAMSAAPALLARPAPRAAASFALASLLLGAEHLARRG